jgi:peptide-methionine (S)-S-oxide reductase
MRWHPEGLQARTRMSPAPGHEIATLGGGCFWCTEAVFSELVGVESVIPGYAGGTTPQPSYEQVCTGRTGHAEVVQVTFDPSKISYHDLLSIFFTVHDPTTLNRQGADVGTQYRSVVLTHDAAQRATAEQVIAEVERAKIWKKRIVTEAVPFTVFYPAEEYHRDYFRRNPNGGYCQMVIAPKVAKFRAHYADRLKSAVAAAP